MRVGIWLYGLGTVVTGILDLVWRAFEASHQPIRALGHIPGEHVLAGIAGAWLVAAGVAILLEIFGTWSRVWLSCFLVLPLFREFGTSWRRGFLR